jgi:hypothetical protein
MAWCCALSPSCCQLQSAASCKLGVDDWAPCAPVDRSKLDAATLASLTRALVSLERTHEQTGIAFIVVGPGNGLPMAKTRKVEVHVTFSDTVRKDNRQTCSIDVASDGSDSVWDVKSRIAVSAP